MDSVQYPKRRKNFPILGRLSVFYFQNTRVQIFIRAQPFVCLVLQPRPILYTKSFFEGNVQDFQHIPKVMNYNTVVINKHYYSFSSSEFKKLSTDYRLVFENEKYDIFVKIIPTTTSKKDSSIPIR